MTNIVKFPTSKKSFLYQIESMKLEDGSYWYRLIQMWDGKVSEWRKLDD